MNLYESAKHIVQTLHDAGHTAYFAGGFVRDYLLDTPSDDIDIASTASVEEVAAIFEKTVPVGVSFGIIIVVIESFSFEVATFRTEDGYEDGRRPTTVEPTDPKTDALRRDFTINGMYYDPLNEEVIDYVNGQKDLSDKIVRAIGDPKKRFQEDRLRMIRAARYAARFNFTLDEKTKKEIIAHAHLLLPAVAIERVRNELEKMAKFHTLGKGLTLLHTLHLLPVIFPSLEGIHDDTIAERLSPLFQIDPAVPYLLQLLFLFPEYTLEEKTSLLSYLKCSQYEKTLVEHDHFIWHTLKQKELSPVKKVAAHASPHFTVSLKRFIVTLSDPSQVIEREKRFAIQFADAIERKRSGKTLVTSSDLIALGIQPSKQLGELLKQGEGFAIERELTTKEEVLAVLRAEGFLQ